MYSQRESNGNTKEIQGGMPRRATCAKQNCHWGALATRKFDKNHPDFFLLKREDLIPSKMQRTRRHGQTPCAQTKKSFCSEKRESTLAMLDDLPEAIVIVSKTSAAVAGGVREG